MFLLPYMPIGTCDSSTVMQHDFHSREKAILDKSSSELHQESSVDGGADLDKSSEQNVTVYVEDEHSVEYKCPEGTTVVNKNISGCEGS